MGTFAGMEASHLEPPDEEGNCPDCEGMGGGDCDCESGCEKCTDGNLKCEHCDGTGFIEYEPLDDDVI